MEVLLRNTTEHQEKIEFFYYKINTTNNIRSINSVKHGTIIREI